MKKILMIILIVLTIGCAQWADSTDIVSPDAGIPQPQVTGIDTVDVVIIYYGDSYGQQTLLAYAVGYAVTTQFVNNSPEAMGTSNSTSIYTKDWRLVNQQAIHSIKVISQ